MDAEDGLCGVDAWESRMSDLSAGKTLRQAAGPAEPSSSGCRRQAEPARHIALALGLAACQGGFAVGFVTAAGLVHQLMGARDEKKLLRFQAGLAPSKLLIIDELGYVRCRRPARNCCSKSSVKDMSAVQPL